MDNEVTFLSNGLNEVTFLSNDGPCGPAPPLLS